MRVLHILDHSIPLHSGYTFRTWAILREQRRLGWTTAQITSAKQGPVTALQETVDGLEFFRTLPPSGALAQLPVLKQWSVVQTLAARLADVVAVVKPDILHAHSPALNGLAALRVAQACGVPLVYEVRAFWEDAAVDHGTSRAGGLRYRATRALETYVLQRATAVTTICEGLRQDIVARGIPAERVTVIPNAVDMEHFVQRRAPNPALQAQLGLHYGQPVVGFIGSFYAYEGLSLLLDALPGLRQAIPNLRVLLVGGGPQAAALQAQAQALGLADSVIFTGRVPHAQVQDYYDLIDVLVYPRLSMRLTELVTPLKPLEAMAQGQLLIASDVGGHRELIRDGYNGILFRAGEAADLTRRLLGLLADPTQWPTLRAQGQHYVTSERTWPLSVARYQTVYAQALAQVHGTPLEAGYKP